MTTMSQACSRFRHSHPTTCCQVSIFKNSTAWGRHFGGSLFVISICLGTYVAVILYTDNFHAVVPGAAYRSGQMTSEELGSRIHELGIRTVVNLRGEHPE